MSAEDGIIMPFNDAAAVERILDRRKGNALKVRGQMVGVGSLFNIHFTDEPIINYRSVVGGDRKTLSPRKMWTGFSTLLRVRRSRI